MPLVLWTDLAPKPGQMFAPRLGTPGADAEGHGGPGLFAGPFPTLHGLPRGLAVAQNTNSVPFGPGIHSIHNV